MPTILLYRKHIQNWEKLSRWRRMAAQRQLMDAIRSRKRRARDGKKKDDTDPKS